MSKKKILICLFFVMLLPASYYYGAYAQNNMVKYEKATNGKPLTDVLKQLEDRFTKKIIFSYEELKNYKVKADIKAGSVEEALRQALGGLPVSYEVKGKYITVKANRQKAATSSSRPANTVRVAGRVVDEQGDGIPAATIKLDSDGNVGTLTNMSGHFAINLEKGRGETLIISFLGMQEESYYVNGRKDMSDITIVMKEDRKALDEVVVIGYGTAKAKDLTGSVARLSEKEIETAPMTSNIAGMLQGRAAGVNVMIANASPTSPVSVVIRGQSSISGDGQPLWVIDGVPQYSSGISGDVSNTLYNLNLNDVQSIDILKDASATAIYGSRAANGVVIVTTKS